MGQSDMNLLVLPIPQLHGGRFFFPFTFFNRSDDLPIPFDALITGCFSMGIAMATF